MSGISFVLNLARGALFAQQQGIAVTAHNIANVNTPGYSRQRPILKTWPRISIPGSNWATGWWWIRCRSIMTILLPRICIKARASWGNHEPENPLSTTSRACSTTRPETGSARSLNEFWNGWQDVADNPSGIPERTALLQKGEALAERFHTIRADLTRIQNEVGNSLGYSLSELNALDRQGGRIEPADRLQ